MNPDDQELVDALLKQASEVADPEHTESDMSSFIEVKAAARLTSLSQANERMAGALEPFAKWADEYGTVHHDSLELWQNGWEIKITVGDCRRARSALAPLGDSLEKAIRELPKRWVITVWSCTIESAEGRIEIGDGPTPLSALRAAIERIPGTR